MAQRKRLVNIILKQEENQQDDTCQCYVPMPDSQKMRYHGVLELQRNIPTKHF